MHKTKSMNSHQNFKCNLEHTGCENHALKNGDNIEIIFYNNFKLIILMEYALYN